MRWRIDELAREAGTTTRTVRAHQARGLLPPPQLQGRTGFYNHEHLQRLRLIDELQERGFSLAAIRQTLDTWATGGDLSRLLGFRHIVTAPFFDEQSATLTPAEMFERFPETRDHPELLERAAALGLIRLGEDGTFTAPSPLLIEAGAELARAGVRLAVILDLVAAITPDLADIARRFVAVVDEHVVTPVQQGRPDARSVDEVVESLRRLRPIAIEVVRPLLAREMQRAADRATHRYADTPDNLAS